MYVCTYVLIRKLAVGKGFIEMVSYHITQQNVNDDTYL